MFIDLYAFRIFNQVLYLFGQRAHIVAMPKGRPASKTRTALGERIAKARLSAGLTQEQLAKTMGVSQRVVTYWEREAVVLRAHQLVELAEVLQTPVEELLGHKRKKKDRMATAFENLRRLAPPDQKRLLQELEKLIEDASKSRSKEG
jgi:transcriptional regulator with XRE-family HTH domain